MKYLILALIFSASAFADNGGDGIVNADGSIQLFDLFERGVDANAMLRLAPRKDTYTSLLNGNILSTKANRQSASPESPQALAKRIREVSFGLSEALHKPKNDVFSVALANEIKSLQWVEAPVDLQPSVDTSPFLDLTKYKRIGCTRNRNGIILFSPNCMSARMSSANIVALLLHVAVSSLYQKRFPDSQDSLNVRTVIAKMIGGGLDAEGAELRRLGLGDLVDLDKKIRAELHVFTAGKRGWTCKTNFLAEHHGRFEFRFGFKDFTTLVGRIVFIGDYRTNVSDEPLIGYGDFPDTNNGEIIMWMADFPRYNSDGSAELAFYTEGDDKISIRFSPDESGKTASITGLSRNSEYNEKFTGSCTYGVVK